MHVQWEGLIKAITRPVAVEFYKGTTAKWQWKNGNGMVETGHDTAKNEAKWLLKTFHISRKLEAVSSS